MASIEEIVGYHCAPAIRGIKVANLVAIPRVLEAEWLSVVKTYNERLNKKGLYFYTLCACPERRLLFVFRRAMLEAYLRRPEVLTFLSEYGYDATASLDEWLARLSERVQYSEQFPHEIGVFLGYPLDDVKAFIRFRGSHYKLCGEWKVYTHRSSAIHAFHSFKMCRDYCQAQLIKGKALDSLVAVTA